MAIERLIGQVFHGIQFMYVILRCMDVLIYIYIYIYMSYGQNG